MATSKQLWRMAQDISHANRFAETPHIANVQEQIQARIRIGSHRNAIARYSAERAGTFRK